MNIHISYGNVYGWHTERNRQNIRNINKIVGHKDV